MNPVILDTLNVMHGIIQSDKSTDTQKELASKVVDDLLTVISRDSEKYLKATSNLAL